MIVHHAENDSIICNSILSVQNKSSSMSKIHMDLDLHQNFINYHIDRALSFVKNLVSYKKNRYTDEVLDAAYGYKENLKSIESILECFEYDAKSIYLEVFSEEDTSHLNDPVHEHNKEYYIDVTDNYHEIVDKTSYMLNLIRKICKDLLDLIIVKNPNDFLENNYKKLIDEYQL